MKAMKADIGKDEIFIPFHEIVVVENGLHINSIASCTNLRLTLWMWVQGLPVMFMIYLLQ